jgi:diguanylate cyclase (GGDEF)-like protein
MAHAATATIRRAGFQAGELTPDMLARRAAQRRQMLLLAAASYGIDAVLLMLYHLAGVTPLATAIGYLATALIVSAVFLALSEAHFNDRFKDHYLTGPQNAASSAIQLIWLYLAPEVGYFFLCLMFIVFGFGALRMSVRQATVGWTILAAGIAVIFLFTDKAIAMPMHGYFERSITMLALLVTIGRFSFVGLYGSMMRESLYKRGKELKQAYARIEELAQFDELTGALNRRMIMAALDEELARAQRNGTRCSVALIDLDHFKRVNDQYGHPVGDETLRTFAITVFANIRSVDKLGRYGGEEFLLVLPDTAPDAAERMMERLRAIVADIDWTAISPGMTVTMSSGITALASGDSADAALARADAALYRAKAAGRNQVVSG